MKLTRIFFIFFIIAAALVAFSGNSADPDLWGHLKYGQDTYERKALVRQDIYSYSSYGAPWINHEWLSELVFYVIFKFSGSKGLLIFKFLTGFIVLFIIYKSVTKSTKSLLLQTVFILYPLMCLGDISAARPHIFTNLFLAITVALIINFERSGNLKWLYALPGIFLIWCNLHGGFIAGMSIILLYTLFKVFQREITKKLLFICLLSVAATFVNPYGVSFWGFILEAISKNRVYISEWQSVKFSLGYFNYFSIVLLAIIGLIFSKVKRPNFETFVILIAIFFSLRHMRHVPLFAILFSLYMPKHVDSFAKDWAIRLENKFPRMFFIYIFALIPVFWLPSEFFLKKGHPLGIEIVDDKYPINAIEFMKSNNINGNIFCFFNWAQMCIRELPDVNKVFFDGRYETVYSDGLIEKYADILFSANEGYKKYLSQFPETDIMLLSKYSPLSGVLSKDTDWLKVYSAGTALIFLKKNGKNKNIIEAFMQRRLIYPPRALLTYFK